MNSHYLRLHDGHWTAGLLPHSGAADVESVQVFGPGDVWAFGTRISGTGFKPKFRPCAARFNGSRWIVVTMPGAGDISAVSAISARDMYALAGLTAPAPSGRLPGMIELWQAWHRMG